MVYLLESVEGTDLEEVLVEIVDLQDNDHQERRGRQQFQEQLWCVKLLQAYIFYPTKTRLYNANRQQKTMLQRQLINNVEYVWQQTIIGYRTES